MTSQNRKEIAKLAAELGVRQRRYREQFAVLEDAKQVILRSVKRRSRAFDGEVVSFSVPLVDVDAEAPARNGSPPRDPAGSGHAPA
jgi:hypothetical protein